MNNGTVSSLSNEINEIILLTYLGTIQVYIYLGSYALLIYASLLRFSDEVEYIWKPKFTLPTYLYLLSKYSFLFYPPLIVVIEFSESLSLCNDLRILSEVLRILPLVGTQGLISIRTYALCQGYYRPMTAIISIIISVSLAALIIYDITTSSCTTSLSNAFPIIALAEIIMIDLLDTLAFIVVIHRVWVLWKLKRSLSLQSNEDLVTSILEQGALRFCFIGFLTTTQVIILFFSPIIDSDFSIFQNVLSTLLVCELTLDFRERNAKKEIPTPSAINLPTLSFRESPLQSIRSALGRLHESIVTEMGEENEPVNGDSSGSSGPGGLENDSHEINLDDTGLVI